MISQPITELAIVSVKILHVYTEIPRSLCFFAFEFALLPKVGVAESEQNDAYQMENPRLCWEVRISFAFSYAESIAPELSYVMNIQGKAIKLNSRTQFISRVGKWRVLTDNSIKFFVPRKK